MKTFLRLNFIIMLFLLIINGCKKDEDRPPVENEDVSDLIANSFEKDAYGLGQQLEDAFLLTRSYMNASYCGYSADTSIYAHYQGVAVQYTYTIDWDWNIHCSGSTANLVNVHNHCEGNCTTSILISNLNSWSDLTITGLEASYSEFILDGTYKRTGDFNSRLRDQHSFNCILNVSLADLMVNKYTYVINGGTAHIDAICTTSDGQEFNFSGTLIFNGNENCTLTLEGKVYTVQL